MGNALHAGDGLTIAEISAVESYSVGMTSESRTTTDDNTASVATRQQLTVSDERDSGGGRLHRNRSATSSKSSSSRIGIRGNPSRNSRHLHQDRSRSNVRSPNRYESKYLDETVASRPSTLYHSKYTDGTDPSRSRSPTRYDNQYLNPSDSSSHPRKRYDVVKGSRTDGSSAYHHGYRMRNDCRDENETYQDGGTYGGGDAYLDGNYRGAGTYQEDSGTYREYEGYEYRYDDYHGGRRSHYNSHNSYNNHNSKNSNHSHRHSRQPAHHQDSSVERGSAMSGHDGIASVTDIRPAETDMAYNGSEEEGEEPREEESTTSERRYGASERESPFHYGLTEEEMRQSKLMLATESEQGTSSRIKSVAPSIEDPEVHPLLEDTDSESLHGDSFSTLTKTQATPIEDPVPNNPAAKRQENERNLKKIKEAAVGSFEQMSTPPLDDSEAADDEEAADAPASPADKKLEELLQQQQLQEEKLQKQLEQLRIQKEKLQQLQGEKTRSSPRDANETFQTLQQSASPPDWSLPEIKKSPVNSKHSRDANSKMSSAESSRHEKTRRQRLEKARAKVMPLSPSKRSQNNDEEEGMSSKKSQGKESGKFKKFVDQLGLDAPANQENAAAKEFRTLEEKYAGHAEMPVKGEEEESTGTATGEMEGSVPEFEDVPSQCQIHKDRPGPFEENDLTTISASIRTELDHTTVSSINDGKNREKQEEELEALPEGLPEALSSMDEEIDLDFVAKYDKAFNAFLNKYPALFDRNSQLIQNLKVAKLQRILEVSYKTECDLETQLESPSETKTNLEAEFQSKLKEASRQKAERSIQLRADLNHNKKQSKIMEGTLTWDMLQLSIKRAIKLNKIKAEIEKKDIGSKDDLLAAMPDGPVMDELKKAMREPPSDTFGSEQKRELQQFQVDNAFLSSEVKVLKEKIEALKAEAKNQEWVDSALLQMDAKKLKKLKTRYQKKLGVSF